MLEPGRLLTASPAPRATARVIEVGDEPEFLSIELGRPRAATSSYASTRNPRAVLLSKQQRGWEGDARASAIGPDRAFYVGIEPAMVLSQRRPRRDVEPLQPD